MGGCCGLIRWLEPHASVSLVWLLGSSRRTERRLGPLTLYHHGRAIASGLSLFGWQRCEKLMVLE